MFLKEMEEGESFTGMSALGKRVFAGSDCGKIYAFSVNDEYHCYDWYLLNIFAHFPISFDLITLCFKKLPLSLFKYHMKCETADALVYIEVAAITNVSNQKLTTAQLNLFLRSKADNSRKPIVSQQVVMTKDKTSIEELGLAVCAK